MPGAYGLSTITPYSLDSIGEFLRGVLPAAPNSQTWAGANRGAFIPFVAVSPMTCKKVFCSNGTSVAGTVDIGVYTADQKRLISSGPTTQAGTSAIQEIDVTDTVLPQGLLYLAISCSSTSATFLARNTNANMVRAAGVYFQGSVATLPATASWNAGGTNVIIPMFGILCGPVP